MKQKNLRVLLSMVLAGAYLFMFLVHFLAASYVESNTLVRFIGYVVDIGLYVALSLAATVLLHDLACRELRRQYLLSALPFLASILYYAAYHTVEYVTIEKMSLILAIPCATLLALFKSALRYGLILLIAIVYRRLTSNEIEDDTSALIIAALPLLSTLLSVFTALIVSLISLELRGSTLLRYLLEIFLSLATSALSYLAIRRLQEKL